MPDYDDFETEQEPRFNEATPVDAGGPVEFHITMRPFAIGDMEQAIVSAAAERVLGRFGDGVVAKQIEARCIELLNDKATKALSGVTDAIIDQPLTPSFGDKKPVTMREFIGLVGREYLTERVDRDGKKYEGGGWGGSHTFTRIELLVSNYLQSNFKREIEKATNAAIVEIQNAVRAQHKEFIETEKKRLRDALTKELAPK